MSERPDGPDTQGTPTPISVGTAAADGTAAGSAPPVPTLGGIGEGATLRQIFPRLPHADAELLGPGDDAAVVRAPDGRFVVTTDMMIHGPDFRSAWSTPHDLGWKAAMSNLADVAAMGARPTALVVAIAAPLDTPVDTLLGIADGFRDACALAAPGCGVVGGDLSVSPALTLAVTAFGDLEGREPVTRSGARPGDVLAVSGDLGRAGAGLWLLFRDGVTPADPVERHDPGEPADPGDSAESSDHSGAADRRDRDVAVDRGAPGMPHEPGEPDRARAAATRGAHPELVDAQLAPVSPIASGIVAALRGATAMLDVSDGLVLDARRIAEASGQVLRLDPGAIDGEAEALRAVDPVVGDRAARFVLAGGEDHALLATFPAGRALPAGFRPLGTVLPLAAAPDGHPDALVGDHTFDSRGGWDPYADWDGHAG